LYKHSLSLLLFRVYGWSKKEDDEKVERKLSNAFYFVLTAGSSFSRWKCLLLTSTWYIKMRHDWNSALPQHKSNLFAQHPELNLLREVNKFMSIKVFIFPQFLRAKALKLCLKEAKWEEKQFTVHFFRSLLNLYFVDVLNSFSHASVHYHSACSFIRLFIYSKQTMCMKVCNRKLLIIEFFEIAPAVLL